MQPYMMNPGNYNLGMSPYQLNSLMNLLNGQGGNGQNNNNMNFMQGNMNYNQQMQQSQQNNPNIEFVGAFVDNFEQVKNYPIPLGGIVLLMDKNNSKLYTKQLSPQGDPIYNVFKIENVDGNSINTQQSQDIQSQQAYIENNNQQNNNNSNQGEQIVADLLNSIKQIKEDQSSLKDKIDKAFIIVDNRLKQLENPAKS